jgi:copper resistance protein B
MRRVTSSLIVVLATTGSVSGWAQSDVTSGSIAAPYGPPVDDQRVYVHVLLEQSEYRAAGSDSVLRWEGEAWGGTDTNRLWIKSQGDINSHGDVGDGQQELLYDRPITSFFDLQTGVRYDLDSGPGRAWVAFGIEGLAPHFAHLSATAYAGDDSRFAARAQAFYDARLTRRLILQTQLELNAYSKDDPERRIGSGLSDVDVGLRLRYEIRRKFAPYLGLSYQRAFGQTADYVSADGESVKALSFLIGIRTWF